MAVLFAVRLKLSYNDGTQFLHVVLLYVCVDSPP